MHSETRTPWHHYIVAVLCLLFYLLGSVDFVLTSLGVGFYTKGFTPEQLTFYATMPVWLKVIWAVSSLGGLLGAWLMWKRSRYAVLVLFLAFAALVFLIVWLWIFARPSLFGVVGFSGLYTLIGTGCIAFLIYTYARWERTKYYLN